MSPAEEKRAAFNQQMNEWVSRQGLWFQLRHAADGQTLVSRILRVLLRILILLGILAFCFWIYLIKRVDSGGFNEKIRLSVESSLKAEECEVGSFKRERKIAVLSFAKMKGTDESFFHHLDLRGIRMNMGLTDSFLGHWNAQTLLIDQLDTKIKAGAGDDANAAAAFQSFFVEEGGFEFERIECKDTTVTWGYSEHNKGSISDSYLIGSRENEGWRLEFKGGTFQQNWLKSLTIKKMVVLCYPEGVSIQEAELVASDGIGTITFRASIGSGSQPSVRGTMQFKSMPMQSLLPASFAEWIQGSISGKGLISGSTNSQEGVVMDLDLEFQDDEIVSVRDNIPLFSALTVVDLYNSYRKVSFNEGSLHIRTGGNLLKISELDLKAGDLLHLRGNVDARLPTHQEIANALRVSDVEKISDVLEVAWRSGDDEGSGTTALGDNVFKQSVLAEVSVRMFDGQLELGLKPDAFDKAPRLKTAYPPDPVTNKIWLDVPLEGRLQTLTLKQAEQLYTLGRKAASD